MKKDFASEQKILSGMRQRCYNPRAHAYKDYGGRGIQICDRWRGPDGLWNFIKDMGRRPAGMSLDRIDVNGDYSPENCRWATQEQQANNTRSNRYLTINSETKTVSQWAHEKGVPVPTLFSRMRYNWPLDKLFDKAHCNQYSPVVVEYRGVTKSLRLWCAELGLKYQTIYDRYRKGKTGDSLFAPPKR